MLLRSRPDIDEEHWFALMAEPDRSNGACARMEQLLLHMVGGTSCLLTHRGSTALDVLWSMIPLRPGDEVVMSTITYAGVADSVIRAGGVPVLVDTHPSGLTAGARELSTGLSTRTRVLMATHVLGQPCNAAEIRELADHYGVLCIEDCAHAFGVTMDGRPAGSFGHAAVFSFGFEKHLTTGRGGTLLFHEPGRFTQESDLGPASRASDLDTLLGAWLEFHGSHPALCRFPFRLDRTGHEALSDVPSLRQRLLACANAGAVPDHTLIQSTWFRIILRQRLSDWWRQSIAQPMYRRMGRSPPPQPLLPSPARIAMGDLRASVGLHEHNRLPTINRHRIETAQRLAFHLRDWTKGMIPFDMNLPGLIPLQLPVIASHPAFARRITAQGFRLGIDLGPHPWRLPLHQYPRLVGRVRPALSSLPVSEQLMPRLRMIPLHSGVIDPVLERIARLLTSID